MTEDEILKNRKIFLDVSRNYIKREGLLGLLEYLNCKTDFFSAPASAAHHLDEPGGLCLHSLNVFETLLRIYKSTLQPHVFHDDDACYAPISEESLAIVALFHDIWKCNRYKPCEKRRRNAYGNWETYPGYDEEDDFPYGHGEKSNLIVSHYLKLQRDEQLAIRWHRGAFEAGEAGSQMRKAYYEACRQHALVPLLQSADMLATLCIDPKDYY